MATPPPIPPAGLLCAACGDTAVVSWQRRPTAQEVADILNTEVQRREQLLLLADPQLPRPDFGPLPTGDGMTRTVFACAQHAITLEGAAHIHEATCTAPNPATLPGCDCTPETAAPEPLESGPRVQLPDHWLPSVA